MTPFVFWMIVVVTASLAGTLLQVLANPKAARLLSAVFGLVSTITVLLYLPKEEWVGAAILMVISFLIAVVILYPVRQYRRSRRRPRK